MVIVAILWLAVHSDYGIQQHTCWNNAPQNAAAPICHHPPSSWAGQKPCSPCSKLYKQETKLKKLNKNVWRKETGLMRLSKLFWDVGLTGTTEKGSYPKSLVRVPRLAAVRPDHFLGHLFVQGLGGWGGAICAVASSLSVVDLRMLCIMMQCTVFRHLQLLFKIIVIPRWKHMAKITDIRLR